MWILTASFLCHPQWQFLELYRSVLFSSRSIFDSQSPDTGSEQVEYSPSLAEIATEWTGWSMPEKSHTDGEGFDSDGGLKMVRIVFVILITTRCTNPFSFTFLVSEADARSKIGHWYLEQSPSQSSDTWCIVRLDDATQKYLSIKQSIWDTMALDAQLIVILLVARRHLPCM